MTFQTCLAMTQKFRKPKLSNLTVPLSKDGNILSLARVAIEFKFFSSVFTDETGVPRSFQAPILHSSMHNINIASEVVQSCIDCLPTNSAPGCDGICPKLLKISKPAICRILAKLFQQCIDTGCVSNDWKAACIILIFKSGDSSNPSNYRLISLPACTANSSFHLL